MTPSRFKVGDIVAHFFKKDVGKVLEVLEKDYIDSDGTKQKYTCLKIIFSNKKESIIPEMYVELVADARAYLEKQLKSLNNKEKKVKDF